MPRVTPSLASSPSQPSKPRLRVNISSHCGALLLLVACSPRAAGLTFELSLRAVRSLFTAFACLATGISSRLASSKLRTPVYFMPHLSSIFTCLQYSCLDGLQHFGVIATRLVASDHVDALAAVLVCPLDLPRSRVSQSIFRTSNCRCPEKLVSQPCRCDCCLPAGRRLSYRGRVGLTGPRKAVST